LIPVQGLATTVGTTVTEELLPAGEEVGVDELEEDDAVETVLLQLFLRAGYEMITGIETEMLGVTHFPALKTNPTSQRHSFPLK
jgi:hypothetical protein